MHRYVARAKRPRSDVEVDPDCLLKDRPTLTVHEPEDEAMATGLYDHHGTPLYRETVRHPMGFHTGARRVDP